MKKLSKQSYKYLNFEIARLRTRWTNDEEHREAIEKRYIEVTKEFNTRTDNWFWKPHYIELAIEKSKHSRTNCMECKEAPTVEVLWAEGMAHAWFCNKHFEGWKKKHNEMSNTGTYEGDIVSQRKINGEACDKWSEPVKKAEFQGHQGKWITVNGKHIFIREGESLEQATERLNPSKTMPKELSDKAKNHFGTTNDYREAGWIMPDGTMLDFSGKNEGGTPGTRARDHTEIGAITPEGSGPQIDYFEGKGGIRFSNWDKGDLAVSLDVNADITDKQWSKLRDAVIKNSGSGSYLAYDIDDGHQVLYSDYYKDISPYDVYRLRKKYKEYKAKDPKTRRWGK